MDDQGWVPIKLIAGFNKVSCLGYMIAFMKEKEMDCFVVLLTHKIYALKKV